MKMKHIAQRGKSSKNKGHADFESSQRELLDGEPEQTPPRNNPPPSASLPEITEELESFDTAQEKAPFKESDEHQGTSVHRVDLPEGITAKQVEPKTVDPNPLTDPSPVYLSEAPIETANQEEVEESPLSLTVANKEGDSADAKDLSEAESESAKKVKESDQDEGVVAIGSSSEDITVKEGRKKQVLKRLGLRSSKQKR
ncbi:hypothetical protein Bca4012_083647 [Brassica carinata]|uniref:Uncharacterized protein n=1 Tax=Brassica carinata TaxID=52824 RepID=A0A8X7SJM9_BRACI|nr:hypothetical protein Bca52824_027080 [Brassica carinata]